MAQLAVGDLGHIVISQHQLGHQQLLVDSPDHHLLVHRLVLTADVIPVKVHIQIIHVLHMGQGLVHENVIHVKCVLGQLQAALEQQGRPVDHGVHEDILPFHEKLHVAPAKYLVLGKRSVIAHHLLALCPLFLVDKVGHQHVQGLPAVHKAAQGLQHLGVGLLVDPVVAVHHLEKDAGGISQACVHRLAVAAVLLVDRLADGGVFPGILVRDLGGAVPGGTVVHDNDLHLLAAGQERLNTVFHIRLRIVAWNCNG